MAPMIRRLAAMMLLPVLLGNCGAHQTEPQSHGRASDEGPAGTLLEGKAVYYAKDFQGKKTASGEPYDMNALTAAHPSLRLGTMVRVTNLSNRRSVVVRINDRGPFGKRDRIIDLSWAAAERIDMIQAGVVEVEVEVLQGPETAEKR